MAEIRTLELRVNNNADEVQQQFENLRQQIAKTTQEVDELTKAYGENSQEVTEAKAKLNELSTSYKELNKVATDTGATFENVYGEMQPLTTRMGEAEDRLYELALAGKTATKEYQDLLKKVSEYRKVQINTDLAVDAASTTMSQKLGGALGGVASGFELAQGTMALFGTESKAIQETLLKVQSAMAISQGIQGLKEASNSFKALGASAKAALSGIKSGIAATGIGVLLIAVGALVAYWDDIKEAVSGVSDEQEELNKKTEANLTAAEEKVGALDKQDNILKLQGKSEKQILELKIKELDATIAIAETNLANQKATKKAQVDAAKRNKDILIGILDFITQPLSIILKSIDEVAAYLGQKSDLSGWFKGVKDSAANLIFDPEATAKEGDEAIKEAENKLIELKNQRAGYVLAIRNIEQQGAQNSRNTGTKTAQEQIDITRQMEEEKNRLMEEGRAKDLDALRIKYKYEQQEADKNFKEGKLKKADYDKLTAQAIESKRADEKAINDKWDKQERDERDKKLQEEIKAQDEQYNALQKAQNSARDQELFELMQSYDAKFELAKNNAELEKALTESFNKEQAAIIEKYRKEEEAKKKEADEKEKARIEQLNKDKFQLAKDGLQLVSDLADLFGQQDEKKARLAFQVDKAAKISSATIAGYEAVLEAYKTGQKSPLTAVFPAYPYVQAGLAGAFAAVNIAKIAKSKFDSSGGGGSMASSGGGGGGAAPMTANFTTIGSSGINQLAQLQQQPTMAYVVSGEVTSAQALDRNRVQNATL